MKIRPVEAELYADGRDEADSRFSQFLQMLLKIWVRSV